LGVGGGGLGGVGEEGVGEFAFAGLELEDALFLGYSSL
jgi:hypothetical protein